MMRKFKSRQRLARLILERILFAFGKAMDLAFGISFFTILALMILIVKVSFNGRNALLRIQTINL